MLMQLVCVDRRYQRMNCFNIRELQGILKRRFFSDLVNSADHRDILSTSMIGLRFKNNNTLNLNHDTLAFFKLGTNNSGKSRTSTYQNSYLEFLNINSYSGVASNSFSSINLHFAYSTLISFTGALNIFYFAPVVSTLSFLKTSSLANLVNLIKLNLGFSFSLVSPSVTRSALVQTNDSTAGFVSYSSSNIYNSLDPKYSFLEQDSLSRFSRFSNPIISYDYKCGNYIGI
jgi:hypothetical protein